MKGMGKMVDPGQYRSRKGEGFILSGVTGAAAGAGAE